MNTSAPANLTRHTLDLPAKFRSEGRFALIPLYHLLRLSDLAREGIDHSGSFRFADHLYRNEASGTGWFGRWLDRRLLNLPASQAMRTRYLRACEQMERAFQAHRAAGGPGPFQILTVPCGIPRDVCAFAARHPQEGPLVEYHGIDLDPTVVREAEAFLAASALKSFRAIEGDALDAGSYLPGAYDFIASTGLGEFLDDGDLARFFRNIFDALAPGGTFFTSAASFDRKSDFLLRTFELRCYYRSRAQLEALLTMQPWAHLEFERHPSGLQTFIRAVKG